MLRKMWCKALWYIDRAREILNVCGRLGHPTLSILVWPASSALRRAWLSLGPQTFSIQNTFGSMCVRRAWIIFCQWELISVYFVEPSWNSGGMSFDFYQACGLTISMQATSAEKVCRASSTRLSLIDAQPTSLRLFESPSCWSSSLVSPQVWGFRILAYAEILPGPLIFLLS